MNKLKQALLIDPRLAGCSGDMFLSTLLDLVENKEPLDNLVKIINSNLNTSFNYKFDKQTKKGIKAGKIQIEIEKDIDFNNVIKIKEAFNAILQKLQSSDEANNLAKDIFQTLISAESKVHGKDEEKLHLHETASLDTIFDILGTVLLLEANNFIGAPILGLPVNTGSGLITITHGKVTVPPPAVLRILEEKNYISFSDEIKGEMVTPTGAAILTNLVTKQITQLPPLKIEKIGYGAGTKDLPDRANVMKIIQIELEEDSKKHYLSMLETHLDDVSGEMLGGIMPILLENGALDVAYYPLIMKKSRPSWCLRVICEEQDASEIAYLMMKELGTLGVRENRFGRYELERSIVSKKFPIENQIVECRFKERMLDSKILGVKPEYEDLIKIRKITKLPLIELEKKLIEMYYLEDEHCE
ncbi:MAG: nickel pincer cofactor biosynthesis protein LarC [Asgard group archaeon]|nr:nickel pincer cofactor biosynthesis protein LarC [Asgard group archaeon]